MKVLWFSVTPISLNANENTGIEGKGWISSLLQIALGIEDLEIVVAYENYSPVKKEVQRGERITVVPINICRYSKREIIKDVTTYREVDQFIIAESQRLVGEYRPDLIHVFGSEWCFGLLAQHVSTPVIIHMQGFWSQIRNCLLLPGQSEFSDRVKFKLLMHPFWFFARYHYYDLSRERHEREEQILRDNHYFMCRTRWDKSVVKFYNPRAKVFHVDEALRPEFMQNDRRWVPRGKDRQIVISTTGACYSIKGPDVALKAARLIKENTDYEVVWKWIGGVRKDLKDYEKLAKVNADEVGVRMMGNLSAGQMIDCLLASDMYVHLSYSDNSPNAVCEAQALGLPVIATDTGGVPSLFSEAYDLQFLIPINDPYYLASKIIELREDQAKAEQLSADNWAMAHQRHDRQRILAQLKQTYTEVISCAQ